LALWTSVDVLDDGRRALKSADVRRPVSQAFFAATDWGARRPR
jgi:hypothetical protein